MCVTVGQNVGFLAKGGYSAQTISVTVGNKVVFLDKKKMAFRPDLMSVTVGQKVVFVSKKWLFYADLVSVTVG